MAETNITASQEQFRYYPYSGTFHVSRNSFFMAGQDSFTQPPAQNADLFSLLQNTEPVINGILQRRRGYSLFSSYEPVGFSFQRSYGFRSDNLNLRELVWSAPGTILVTDEAGNVITTNLFVLAGSQAPRMVLSRDFGYFADGVASDYQKWNGTVTGTSNWGINVASVAASSAGPSLPTSGTNVTGFGTVPWTTPGNITSSGAGNATVTLSGSQQSNYLFAGNFGFSVGANLITGIQLDIFMSGTTVPPLHTSFRPSLIAAITQNGTTTVGTSKNAGIPNTTLTKVTLGGPTDLWGNSSFELGANFGILLEANANNTSTTYAVDYVQVTLFFQLSAIIATPAGGGNVTLLNGRIYFYAYQNSSTGTTSNISSPSISTGPITSQVIQLTGIPTCTDPQVDTVLILATADGGDETTLYLVTSLPNGTSSYLDNTPDALSASVPSGPSLLTANIYQDTDANQNLHGIANNNPPPAANFPTLHKGRIYMASGPSLYYSKNLTDVTTATGTITSKWEEAWPAENQIEIGLQDQTIQGMLSDGETLWIGTERSISRLIGDSPDNFQVPEVQFNEAGLVNQEVWKVVFYEGQPVGTMWLTPDLRVMASDFNTYQDVGTPIQDVLLSATQSVLSTTAHSCFVSGGAFDLWMLYIATNGNPTPDTCCVYNMRTQKWTIWKPADRVTTSLFNINAQGTSQWLFGTSVAGSVSYLFSWDQLPATAYIDRNGVQVLTIPVTAETSWLDMGDPTLRKALNEMLATTLSTTLQLTVYGATTENDFVTNVNMILGPVNFVPGPLGDLFVPLAGYTTKYRWYKFVFTSLNDISAFFLSSYNVEAVPIHRW